MAFGKSEIFGSDGTFGSSKAVDKLSPQPEVKRLVGDEFSETSPKHIYHLRTPGAPFWFQQNRLVYPPPEKLTTKEPAPVLLEPPVSPSIDTKFQELDRLLSEMIKTTNHYKPRQNRKPKRERGV